MEHRNYLSIAQPSFWHRHFCYIDRKEYFADELFVKHSKFGSTRKCIGRILDMLSFFAK